MPLDLAHVSNAPDITDDEVVCAFATILTAMRDRGIIRTKNVVGDLGERYAVHAYAQHGPRGALSLQPTNSTDVDAVDTACARYAIKAASPGSTRTSTFHFGEHWAESEALVDYVVVVRLNDHFQLDSVVEFTWKQFWQHKAWSKRQHAWFLPLTQKVLRAGRAIGGPAL
ncbi:MAG: hypothetical protein HZA93_21070 [Verrucomicrobia bacterium]|nr:hypothetical protein [Verrucomicrobiota bacterium]